MPLGVLTKKVQKISWVPYLTRSEVHFMLVRCSTGPYYHSRFQVRFLVGWSQACLNCHKSNGRGFEFLTSMTIHSKLNLKGDAIGWMSFQGTMTCKKLLTTSNPDILSFQFRLKLKLSLCHRTFRKNVKLPETDQSDRKVGHVCFCREPFLGRK